MRLSRLSRSCPGVLSRNSSGPQAGQDGTAPYGVSRLSRWSASQEIDEFEAVSTTGEQLAFDFNQTAEQHERAEIAVRE